MYNLFMTHTGFKGITCHPNAKPLQLQVSLLAVTIVLHQGNDVALLKYVFIKE